MNTRIEEDDDWNPIPNQDSILNKQIVQFTDKQIKQHKQIVNNQIFDDSHVIQYAQDNWISDDDDDESEEATNNTNKQINGEYFDFEKMKKQLMQEQSYFDPLQDYANERQISSKYRKNNETGQVINCPNCFIQLSYQCQQHTTYKNQYRAMFVINSNINQNKLVKPQEDEDSNVRTSKQSNDMYFAVNCAQCNVEVAVYEVKCKLYHFFNVIPGYG